MQIVRLLMMFAAMAALLPGGGHGQSPAEPELRVVKYAGLKEAVLKERGKVLLVDFWGIG